MRHAAQANKSNSFCGLMVACSPFSKPTNVQHLHTIYCYRAIRSRIRLLLLAVGVIYIFFARVYVCNSFNFGQTERVEMKKCSKRIKCFLIWQSQRKELIFYHSLFPIIYSTDYYLELLYDAFSFFSTVGSYICSFSEVAAAKLVSFLFARNAKTPIVIYDLRVWTWDNVLCFIASILIQAIKFIQFLFVAVGSSSFSRRYRQSPFLGLPYRPCHSRFFLIHFSFLEQLNKCFYIDYMHLIYSLKCPLSFIWPVFLFDFGRSNINSSKIKSSQYVIYSVVHCLSCALYNWGNKLNLANYSHKHFR